MKLRTMVTAAAAATLLAGCGSGPAAGSGAGSDADPGQITMGFSQVGAESGWRTANTKSIQDAAGNAGVDLKFSDANGEQENQISAIRSFVQQRVDVIAFSPVVRTGWDAVLLEAKNAGIPVILTDRAVDTDEPDVYKTFLGADFVDEGRRAGDWVVGEYASTPGPVNIVTLEGTTGADPAIDRNSGFAEAISADPDLRVIASQSGDFTRSGGKQVMEAFLKANPKIDLVFAQNDDMGLGAMEAIEAAGRKPGQDIKIVTIDATRDGMQALADGKFNFIVECNPLLGPQLMELAEQVVAGEPVPARVVTPDEAFDQQQAAAVLPDRAY
ncbi:ABC transporter substrate-binding protein [Mycolicibacterium diernhoferi]|uniref:LacI family transcriptional regulator n=1 Tax=Mycolicibacterium diernhoferi TaxID=1801 RepID=A0A1Q4HA93_9MYCO|nr:ABC transporter substrate-binding protein [Mycolicibacterium diernhoferi]OJZ64457.1 LacI family transcriptional regulator [Mycolicibacterium diernhoferi]OPE54891.1 LacI family transcriptional regulator [Mycolicibacterium diernhoferi]PEG52321.1 LacI family transcriptional regulator [Mycolicibacterium diernhoferi]QYL24281.1 ABC transporter substrate-binding protein [Mycolicibacterium diernhoferi]